MSDTFPTTPKILIVEDTEELRNAIATALDGKGYEVLSVADGEEGYLFAKRMQPHLMLVDVMMPRTDGISMIKKIQKEEWSSSIKFIILTNVSNDDVHEQAREIGVEDYYIKSESPLSTLVSVIDEKLQYLT
ncbi:response regulator [candidate division WWE3 bacterium]|uniref:Response regulator n=1 Tax=candidate division WWE3 bacterium TaxID=2053526 RepID=A0A955LVX1_UNCKA|nr:response regulator [candidate division WWE3 bacterium]